MAIQVSIVDDDVRTREGLALMINGSDGYECLSVFANAEDALEAIPRQRPDVVLVDIHLPKMSGIECVRELKKQMPHLHLIMLTVFEEEEAIFNSFTAGASGYLLKKTPPSKLLESLTEVYQGFAPMSGRIARLVVQHFQQAELGVMRRSQLTAREQEILSCLAKGFRYKEIADQLGIGFDTVRSHLRRVYEKLQVTSRTEAVVKFLRR